MAYRLDILKKFKEFFETDDAKIIETSIFKYCVDYKNRDKIPKELFKSMYLNKSRQLYHNLKEDSYINNKYLLENIKNGKIKLETVVSNKFKLLHPKIWTKYNDDLEILNKEVADFNKEMTTTDQFTCNKCKQSKCVYTQFQVRSCDEAATTYITCINCGNNWTEN